MVKAIANKAKVKAKTKSAAKTFQRNARSATVLAKDKPSTTSEKSQAPAASEAVATVPVITEITHTIALEPRDWFWAMWRDPEPLAKPKVRPFDKDAILDAMRAVRGYQAYNALIPADPLVLSPAEAEFWLLSNSQWCNYPSTRALADGLAKKKLSGAVTLEEFLRRQKRQALWQTQLVLPLLGPQAFVDFLLTDKVEYGDGVDVFRSWVLPYLTRRERESLRKTVRAKAQKAKVSADPREDFPVECQLACALGCHEVAEDLVAQYPNNNSLGKIVWGLGSAEQVMAEVDRLNAEKKLWDFDSRAWLAHTGSRRLELLRDRAMSATKAWGGVAGYVAAIALVKDPVAASYLLELRCARKASEVATAWLDEQLGNAVAGLLPVAAGRGALADAARNYLREKQRCGFGAVIEKCLKQLPPEDAQRLRDIVPRDAAPLPVIAAKSMPQGLRPHFATAATLPMIAGCEWLNVTKLPPLALQKQRLADEQVVAVLRALGPSEFSSPHPLVANLRKFADPDSLAQFAWTLFELWQANGAPSKHRWAMRSLGYFGNDETAAKLAPLVRAWPGESQHTRAVLGLECLRAIGSDAALMHLSGIAQKVKFKALQQRAMECVEQIAAEKGLTRNELEDRVVPDCGLDERGTREFDFGPRKFSFALDADNKPVVRDAGGAIRKDLPRPAAKDDAGKAEKAVAEWKQLKLQIRDVLKIQVARLEQALITGRRWNVADFETLLVRQPLMTNLVRRLLWTGFDGKGKRQQLFRVTDERDYADVDDKSVSLARVAHVGVVHPLHLTDDERARWGEMFTDYEIVPPFPQLGRPVHRIAPSEKKASSLARFKGMKIPALTLLGRLDRHGWTRGMPQDNGVFQEHYKHFFAADITAVITYDGISMGYQQEVDQKITGSFFVPGIYKPRGWPNHKRFVKLGEVDPIVLSEVISDMTELQAKAV